MAAEMLDANFYRERARLCHKLAESATAATPVFARLRLLAKTYEEKAEAAESKVPLGKGAENFGSPNHPPKL
jgi:hypothetical protein